MSKDTRGRKGARQGPRRGTSSGVPHGFKGVAKDFFDECYSKLIDSELLDRKCQWDERNCSVLWNDVHGNPVFLLVDGGEGVQRYIKNSYMKYVFAKER